MTDPATIGALRDAIQADMRSRLDALTARLEREVETVERLEELERVFTDAFTEVTHVFACGVAARLRESRQLRD